jgi:tetratricopeptide repeat protein
VRVLEKKFARWGSGGAVAELFGTAYMAVRDVSSAIRWLERAVAADDGTASMNAVEQLANARIRLAWETVEKAQRQRDDKAARVKEAGGGRRAADQKVRAAAKRSLAAAEGALRTALVLARSSVKEAITLLEKLVAVQPTMERESLHGSAYKRLAVIAAAAGRPTEERQAIEAMKRHYERAAVIGREREASNVFYPGLNYLAAELALNTGRRGWKGADASIIEATGKSLDAMSLEDPDFWTVAGQTALQMYKALAGGAKLASVRESVERGYQDLYRRVSAAWMWASVYEDARFVLHKYMARATANERKAAAALLERLATFAQLETGTGGLTASALSASR